MCLPTPHVDSIAVAEGFSSIEPTLFERLFVTDAVWLGPRNWLENDEGFRQLVSYVVFRHENRVLIYRRTSKGGESRLHGRWSLGVGGHVNAADLVTNADGIDLASTLQRACEREIAEEVECGPIESLETIGLIKETTTNVSRVHLGVVAACWLSQPRIVARDPGLVDVQFVPVGELPAWTDQMETWSACLVDYLNQTVKGHSPSRKGEVRGKP